jgi:hypothetical protein
VDKLCIEQRNSAITRNNFLINIVLMRCMALSVTGDNFPLFLGSGRPANQSTGAQFYKTVLDKRPFWFDTP